MAEQYYGPHDRPPIGKWIPLSFQHVFAMFGATVLVPLLTGLSTSTALFTAGTGTLIYILITGAKVPAFLGSSFAFIPALIAIGQEYGAPYAMGGAIFAGIFYALIALIIKFTGKNWIDKALPPVVIGSVIIVIGLGLASTAIGEFFYKTEYEPKVEFVEIKTSSPVAELEGIEEIQEPSTIYVKKIVKNEKGEIETESKNVYSLICACVAAVTLLIAIIATIFFKGFFNTLSILIGLIGGYIFALVMGLILPKSDWHMINFEGVKNAPWFCIPFLHTDESLAATGFKWILPKFNIVAILTFVIVSISTVCEHMGDTLTTSKVVGQDFYKEPGLHRTLLGDGVATAWAALWGGPPNTTYGENIGVMAITKVYSVWVIGGAAVIAIVLSFCGKFGALISTIPTPVLGGICTLLYGLIASSGLRTIVDAGVDYQDKRNLTISSVILVLGIGGASLNFAIGSNFNFALGGVALATVVGIILNLIIPKTDK